VDEAVRVRVEDPVPPAVSGTEAGLKVVVTLVVLSPLKVTAPVRATLPTKPMLWTVTVEVAEPPGETVPGLGAVAVRVKSEVTTRLIIENFTIEPLVPVTLML